MKRKNSLRAIAVLSSFCLSFSASFVLAESMNIKSQVADLKAKMEQKVQEDQTGRYIVQLTVPYQAEMKLDRSTKMAQRKSLQMAQADFLKTELAGVTVSYSRPLTNLPLVVVELDAQGLEELTKSGKVEAVYEDKLSELFLQDSGPLIGADVAWNAGYSGQGQTVAILDTGVQSGHPFFGGRVVKEACFSSTSPANSATSLCPNGQDSQTGSGAALPCNGIAGCDHGTHVAGIAAGKGSSFSGVAKDANIIAVNVFSKFSSSSVCQGAPPCILSFTSDQIEGLQHIVTLANANQEKISSINMSIGGGKKTTACDSDPRKLVIDQLRGLNIATVIASGNNGFTDGISFPACISSAISVGSTTKSDGVSGFSNSASFLKLLAPGSSIKSSVFGGGFGPKSGTSMAAPQVAGAWAVVKSKDPSASVDDVLAQLETNGKSITDSRNNITKPRIDLKYMKKSPDSSSAGKRCYAWANNSTAASYTPSLTYSYNSSGKPIKITRSSAGKYSVRCEGIGGDRKAGGHVQVTAYGFDTHNCKVRYWSSFGKDFVANVACYSEDGAPKDARYTISVEGPMK